MGTFYFHKPQRKRIREWVLSNTKEKNGLLIYGPTGCGKSFLVKHSLQALTNFRPLFLNSFNTYQNTAELRKEIDEYILFRIPGVNKVLVIDDSDFIIPSSRAHQEIKDILKVTKVPTIIISDSNSKKIREYCECEKIEVLYPKKLHVKHYFEHEGLLIPKGMFETMYRELNCVRKITEIGEYMKQNKIGYYEARKFYGAQDEHRDMYRMISNVFSETEMTCLQGEHEYKRERALSSLLIHENYTDHFSEPKRKKQKLLFPLRTGIDDCFSIAESLSFADTMETCFQNSHMDTGCYALVLNKTNSVYRKSKYRLKPKERCRFTLDVSKRASKKIRSDTVHRIVYDQERVFTFEDLVYLKMMLWILIENGMYREASDYVSFCKINTKEIDKLFRVHTFGYPDAPQYKVTEKKKKLLLKEYESKYKKEPSLVITKVKK